jgi:hypothetical protein
MADDAPDVPQASAREAQACVDLAVAKSPPSRALANRRQTKLESGTVPGIAGCPQLSCVIFDDRAADQQSHAVGLRREERLEQPICIGRIDARAAVLHRDHRMFIVIPMGLDQQVTWVVADVGHRLDTVDDQIDEYLLKLNPIAEHGRQPVASPSCRAIR